MALDLARMLERCDRLQWSVDDIDWQAPGRELVTPEQADRLKGFMADLVWIEFFGTYVFEAMAKQATDPELKAIYLSFAGDERRHADAEQRLMVRWGMLPRDVRPEPNVNARRAITFLREHSEDIPLSVYAAILPMFEIALDGALLQFLTATVKDPVCTEVFRKVNQDEARHLAVDFHMLEALTRDVGVVRAAYDLVSSLCRPSVIGMTLLGYLPLLERAFRQMQRMGVPLEDLSACMRKYRRFGKENPAIARLAPYWITSIHSVVLPDPAHRYHLVAGTLLWLSEQLDLAWLPIPFLAPARSMRAATQAA